LEKTKSGEFFVNNVPPGEQDLIVTAGALQIGATALRLTAAEPTLGIRMNGLRSTSGLRNTIGEIVLPPLSEVSGVARLNSASLTDFAGISVYIPGTGFSALTAPDGKYTIKGVPAGAHALFFEKDGFARGQIEGLVVTGESSPKVPDIDLYLDAGISGSFSILNSTVVNNKTVVLGDSANLLMAPSNGAVLMLLGDGQSAATWQSVRTNFNWKFSPSDFLKPNQWGYAPTEVSSPVAATLVTKFANANGLESDAITKTMFVDFFSDGVTRFLPQFDVNLNPNPRRIDITDIKIPEQAEEMAIIYQTPSGSWPTPTFGPLLTNKSIAIADTISNCGSHGIDVQFRGYGGKVTSQVSDSMSQNWLPFTKTIVNSCHTPVPSTSAISKTGMGDQGFSDKFYGVWTGTEVVIFG
jgi:hypothetical protein